VSLIINSFDTDKAFDYENGFNATSDVSRTGKMLAHYELYKLILDLPGDVAEFGVFKGASLIRFASFRELLENEKSREIIGFDTFGTFPDTQHEDDQSTLKNFVDVTGGESFSVENLNDIMAHKNISNVSFVSGDICETLPQYLSDNPHKRFSLIHIDTDIYEPAKVILANVYNKLVRGGVIVFDDYTSFAGETLAVDEFLDQHKDLKLNKFPFSHGIPSYIVKP
jgi:predicted O-methyltransferase YrrM